MRAFAAEDLPSLAPLGVRCRDLRCACAKCLCICLCIFLCEDQLVTCSPCIRMSHMFEASPYPLASLAPTQAFPRCAGPKVSSVAKEVGSTHAQPSACKVQTASLVCFSVSPSRCHLRQRTELISRM